MKLRDWFLLDINRTLLAGGFLSIALAVFLWLEVTGVIHQVRNPTPLLWLFSGIAGGNFTLITIVISINQLVLARELRSPRELMSELRAAEEYRVSVKNETHQPVVPEQPHEFLHVLATNTRHRARELDGTGDETNGSALDEIESLRSNVLSELDPTVTDLERTERKLFPALSTILDADFSSRLTHSRWIRQSYSDDISETLRTDLEEIEEGLEYLDIARQYLKTICIQKELAGLSKQVIYTGFIAEIVSLTFIVYTGYLRSQPPLLEQAYVIPVAITVSLAPLALLLSHVLRIATLAERTVAITPFLSPR